MMRQYVACQFRPGDQRSYTYHNDGDPVEVGDRVRVEGRKGESTVTVGSILDAPPKFATKAILGPVETAVADPPKPVGPLL